MCALGRIDSDPPFLCPLNVRVNLFLAPDNGQGFSTTIDGINRRVVNLSSGNYMQAREIRTHRRQKFRLFKEYEMVGIGECVLRYSRLFRLSQTTVAAVFINGTAETFAPNNLIARQAEVLI